MADANVTMARHYTICYQCSHHRLDPGKYCDDGWALAKAVARAQGELRRQSEVIAGRAGQGTLW